MWEDKHKAVSYNSFRSEVIHFKNYVIFFKQMLTAFQGVANIN